MKKQINIFSKILLVFSLVFSVFVINSNNQVHAQDFNDAIVRTYITNRDGGVLNEDLRQWQQFRFNADFKLPTGQIHGGDTTVIQLPNEITFSDVSPFEIKDANNQVVANGKLNKDNKTITLTYTPAIETANEVNGTLYAYMRVDHEVIETPARITVNATVGTHSYLAGEIGWKGLPPGPRFDIVKNSWKESIANEKLVRYRIMVNTSQKQMDNLVVADKFRTPGISYVPNTFKVLVGNWAWRGGEWRLDNQEDKTNLVQKRINNSDFEIEIGNLPTDKGVIIDYSANINYDPVDGEMFYNDAKLITTNNVDTAVNSAYRYVIAAGTAQGYTHTIKINKVDDQNRPVQNAVFEVIRKRVNVSVGEITTDTAGVGTLGNLLKDDYVLREKVVPNGYRKAVDTEVASSDFDAVSKVAEKTIVNLPMEYIQIPVKKTWIGPVGAQVEVKLYEEDNQTTEVASKVITVAENWEHVFTNIPKYTTTDKIAKYILKETPVANYTSVVEGDQTAGFTVKNTNTEVIELEVSKLWNGPKLEKIEVKVFNEEDTATELQTKEISEATGWKAVFDNLPKYNADGNEAKYTVVETPIANYDATVGGNQTLGFTILNKNNEKISVPVMKLWDGPEQASIEVKIYNKLDLNVPVDTATITAAQNWEHVFTNLPKYNADGSVAKYAVKETPIANYDTTIEGNNDLFVITNKNKETINIPVEKRWIGEKTPNIEVKLYHEDDEVNPVATAVITEVENWKHVFENLPKYNQDGSEAQYIVKETEIDGYVTKITEEDGVVIIENTQIVHQKGISSVQPAKPEGEIDSAITKKAVDSSDNTLSYVAFALVSLFGIVFLRKDRK